MAKRTAEAPKKKSKLPMLVVVGIVAFGGYKFMGPGKAAPEKPAAEGEHADVAEGAVVALPDLTLNLADREPRYLRVGIALVLEEGTSTEAVKEELPIASDVAVDLLSSKTYEELHAPGAKQTVKEELSRLVREAFHGERVARVIFTSFVMQ